MTPNFVSAIIGYFPCPPSQHNVGHHNTYFLALKKCRKRNFFRAVTECTGPDPYDNPLNIPDSPESASPSEARVLLRRRPRGPM